ncbi:MAG: oligopeptide transporter, OPT family [Thermoplasmata archaeon]|nr:MAG: oligopeptide transporter, OPT family [Thermoplasmata archaeon]
MADEEFVPYVRPEVKMLEITVRALVLGLILSVVMAAANAYLGLKVGMTVSAAIPAAVISAAVFKGLKGTVLEITVSKTMASTGESLAAGVIFTIPALVIIGVWDTIDYGITTAVALVGGILGVLFTVLLRKILIIDLDLPFPEGVASAEVIIAAEKGGKAASYVFGALGIGAFFKMGASLIVDGREHAIGLWKDKVEGVASAGRANLYGGSDLSVALLGVGYIIGARIASLILMGGIIGWVIIAPIIIAVNGLPVDEDGVVITDMVAAFNQIRFDHLIFVGVGTMIVGSFWTLWTMRKAIIAGVKKAFPSKDAMVEVETVIRTEEDLSVRKSLIVAGLLVIPIFAIYYFLSGSFIQAFFAAIIGFVAAFLFTTVAGYLAGIIGSSNNPISGVTIATLLIMSIVLFILGARGEIGMATAIGVAALICCCAAIAGDVTQSLKTGQLMGSTPKYLQISMFIGVAVAAVVIAPTLTVLHAAYGIGSENLPAPQALAMKGIVEGIFGGRMNWLMVFFGMELAVLLIILKKPVLPIAIGLYLPFSLTIPIMLGGIVHLLVDRKVDEKYSQEVSAMGDEKARESKLEKIKEKVHNKGVLFASGLIAGEALMGIILAVLVVNGVSLAIIGEPIIILGVMIFLFLAFMLWWFGQKSLEEDQLE